MKKLSEFIPILQTKDVIDFTEAPVNGLRYLAEDIQANDIFFCIDEFLKYGQWMEGRSQLAHPALKKASALVAEKPSDGVGIPQLIVDNPIQAMAAASRYYYDTPDESLTMIGITGTNGKTTISHLIRHLLSHAGYSAASMGTIGVYTGPDKKEEMIYTTPLSPELFAILHNLVENGVTAVAAEISSHSLKLDRVYGLRFDAAVFSNISRDHLDFHSSVDDYVDSKAKIVEMTKPDGVIAVNIDDPYAERFIEKTNGRVIKYGFSESSDIVVAKVNYFPDQTRLVLEYKGQTMPVTTQLTGRFNVYNVLAGIGACIGLGVDFPSLEEAIASFTSVDGRMEIVKLPGNRVGIVDYSHTPDALQNALETLRETTGHRIITVFGCGGDRDRGKRPIMGDIASRLSDICIVTSDNPRTEDPNKIIDDILVGVDASKSVVESNRREAIRKAYEISRENDVILVAGKGHETYQIIGIEKHHFSDKEELLRLWNWEQKTDMPSAKL